jgi:hypothetical protein
MMLKHRLEVVVPAIAVLTALAAGPRWAEIYKTGKFVLAEDSDFGRGVDWAAELFDDFQEIAVAPDGSVFVVSVHQSRVRKFDSKGRPVLTFGKSGQGPGDLQSPNSPGVLDGRLLVVSEYATLHRISLFDLHGKFVKILKTERPVFDVVPLRDGWIAYLSTQSSLPAGARPGAGAQSTPAEAVVAVKSVETGAERVVWKARTSIDGVILPSGGMIGFGESQRGAAFIQATPAGRLAVGFSAGSRIEVFSPRGDPVRNLDLDLPVVAVRAEHVARFRKAVLPAGDSTGRAKAFREAMAGVDFAPLFGKTLPLYRDFRTDSDGNLLFLLRNDDFRDAPVRWAAYSPEGKLLGRFEMDPDAWDMTLDPRFKTIQFSASGLIGLASRGDDPDASPRLFRVGGSGPNPRGNMGPRLGRPR